MVTFGRIQRSKAINNNSSTVAGTTRQAVIKYHRIKAATLSDQYKRIASCRVASTVNLFKKRKALELNALGLGGRGRQRSRYVPLFLCPLNLI